MTEIRSEIARKNDRCRGSFLGCKVLLTSMVAGHEDLAKILQAVREYSSFNEDNDPYGEHDFGEFMVNFSHYFWKIDYFDDEYKFYEEDGNRVLTIGRADEY